jgi:hypothetical protein
MPLNISEVKEIIGDLVISIHELQKELAAEKSKTEQLSAKLTEVLADKKES